jgi:uncharacterized protein (TIGR00297 family)
MILLTLNKLGVAVAVVLALLLLFLGNSLGWFMVALMLYFLVLAFLVTYLRLDYKEKRGLTERTRGVMNVLSNGLAPLGFAALYCAGSALSNNILALAGLAGFVGAVAAITADKFSSELGVLDGLPRVIFTMKVTKKGRSGAVTWFGLAMGAVGAFLVAQAAVVLMGGGIAAFGGLGAALIVAIMTASGFLGSVVDSMFGYFEELGIGNKHTSNLLCSILGGVIAVALVLLLL